MGQRRDRNDADQADDPLSIEDLERLLAEAVRAGSVPAMRLAHRIHRQREEREAVDRLGAGDDLDARRQRAIPIPARIERLERTMRHLLRRVEELEHDLDQAQSEAGEALELAERAAARRRS